MKKFGLLEAVNGLPKVEGVEGVHPIGSAGVNGVAGEHLAGEIRVDGTQFPKDGQQDGIVPGVAPAIGAADDHLIPSVFSRSGEWFHRSPSAAEWWLQWRILVWPSHRAYGPWLSEGAGSRARGEQMVGQRTVIPGGNRKPLAPWSMR